MATDDFYELLADIKTLKGIIEEECSRAGVTAYWDDNSRKWVFTAECEDGATRKAEAKARVRERYEEYLASPTQRAEALRKLVDEIEAERQAKAEAERQAEAEAKAAERKAQEARAWAEWDELDAKRTAAFSKLEDSINAATLAASRAAEAYPGNKFELPKRYGSTPENPGRCFDMARSQSEELRRRRAQVEA
jgi:colicin import membrane protein